MKDARDEKLGNGAKQVFDKVAFKMVKPQPREFQLKSEKNGDETENTRLRDDMILMMAELQPLLENV